MYKHWREREDYGTPVSGWVILFMLLGTVFSFAFWAGIIYLVFWCIKYFLC